MFENNNLFYYSSNLFHRFPKALLCIKYNILNSKLHFVCYTFTAKPINLFVYKTIGYYLQR